MIMETEKFHNLPSASGRLKEVSGVNLIQVRGLRTGEPSKSQSQGRRRPIWLVSEFAQWEIEQEIEGLNCAFTQFSLTLLSCPEDHNT